MKQDLSKVLVSNSSKYLEKQEICTLALRNSNNIYHTMHLMFVSLTLAHVREF